jgi:hypothetical protein
MALQDRVIANDQSSLKTIKNLSHAQVFFCQNLFFFFSLFRPRKIFQRWLNG